ncbi:MAG: ferredoxin [bacterium]|nr:cytochrome [Deltaproteobacteria bacterium]MCP4908951.1 ferredoxin [bacterium]
MRIRVDREKCTGHGRCYTLAPQVYQPDDEGSCIIPNEQVSAERSEVARRGALNCPEDAIEIFEE